MRQLHHSSSSESIECQRDRRRQSMADQESTPRSTRCFKLHPMAETKEHLPADYLEDDQTRTAPGDISRSKLLKTLNRQKSQVRSIAQKSYVLRLVEDIERLMKEVYKQESCLSVFKPEATELFREGDIVLKAMQIRHPMFQCTKHRDPNCNCYLIQIADKDLSKKMANLRKMLLDCAKSIAVPNLPKDKVNQRDTSTNRSRSSKRPPPKLAYSSNKGHGQKQAEDHFAIFKSRPLVENKENRLPRHQVSREKVKGRDSSRNPDDLERRLEVIRPSLAPLMQTEGIKSKIVVEAFNQDSPSKVVKKRIVLSPANISEKFRVSPERITQRDETRLTAQNEIKKCSTKWSKPTNKNKSREKILSNQPSPSQSPRQISQGMHQLDPQSAHRSLLDLTSDSQALNQSQSINLAYRGQQSNSGMSSFRGDNILPSSREDTVFDMISTNDAKISSKYRTVSMSVDDDSIITCIKTVEDRLVVAGFSDGSFVVFSILDDFKPVCAYREHEGPVTLISTAYIVSDTSNEPTLVLLTAAHESECTLAVWDCETFELCKKLGGHESSITSAKDLMNDFNIVTAASDGKFAFWNLAGAVEFVSCVDCSSTAVLCLEYDQSSSTLFSGSHDGLVSVWQISIHSHKNISASLSRHVSSCAPVIDLALWPLMTDTVVVLGLDGQLRLLSADDSGGCQVFQSNMAISDFFMVDQQRSLEPGEAREPMVFGVNKFSEISRLSKRQKDKLKTFNDYGMQENKIRCSPNSQLLVTQGNLVMLRVDHSRPSFSLWRINI